MNTIGNKRIHLRIKHFLTLANSGNGALHIERCQTTRKKKTINSMVIESLERGNNEHVTKSLCTIPLFYLIFLTKRCLTFKLYLFNNVLLSGLIVFFLLAINTVLMCFKLYDVNSYCSSLTVASVNVLLMQSKITCAFAT